MVSQDIRYTLRGLFKRPLFTVIVVLTIALGIGVNTAIFSVVNGILLTPLPFEEPDELVMVWEHNLPRAKHDNVVSPANFFAWREENTVFEDVVAVYPYGVTLTGDGAPERVGVLGFTSGFFEILRTNAHIGRTIGVDDFDGPPVVMLSYGFWRRWFGSDPSVIGRSITLNGADNLIVGVLPEGFGIDLPYDFDATGTQDLFRPVGLGPEERTARGRWMQVLARLGSGVTLSESRAQMATVARRLEQEYPEFQTGWRVNVVPLHQQIVGEARTPVLILFGAVTLVLLIACANVANLLLSRASSRTQELAVRSALGAGRLRLIRQMLTESLILGVAGGALGLLLAVSGVNFLIALEPAIPRLEHVEIDGTVMGFSVMVSLLTVVLFGLLPAIRASSLDVSFALKEGGIRGTLGGHARTRSALVVTEVALSLMLLVGSGLLLRSFSKLLDVGVGFDVDNVITAQVQLPSSRYPERQERVRIFEELVTRVQSIQGVSSASAITWLPLAGPGSGTRFWVNDRTIPPAGELPVADIRWVQRDYHKTMGIPLLAGRHFDTQDSEDAPLAVVVSEHLAQEFWSGESAIGRSISMPWGDTLVAEIIGVVGDVRHFGPDTEPRSMIYWHHQQFQDFGFMSLVARTTGEPRDYASAVRRKVEAVDSDLAIYRVHTMRSYLGDAVAPTEFAMLALSLFSVVALILASIGIYGVMSYSVSQRTQEFGIRMALGADGREVAMGVVRKGALLVGTASAVGLVGAMLLSKVMQGMVFGISTNDPLTLAGVTLFLGVVALLACYIPARRASKVDPLDALRYE
jgi:putative ABC transport system permease protein